jgi:hypothetical protein
MHTKQSAISALTSQNRSNLTDFADVVLAQRFRNPSLRLRMTGVHDRTSRHNKTSHNDSFYTPSDMEADIITLAAFDPGRSQRSVDQITLLLKREDDRGMRMCSLSKTFI